ncbi:MAG: hypothetical protein ACTSQS_19105 [Promethearchaeota archaeon]
METKLKIHYILLITHGFIFSNYFLRKIDGFKNFKPYQYPDTILGLEPDDKTGKSFLPIHPYELRARPINWLMKKLNGLIIKPSIN